MISQIVSLELGVRVRHEARGAHLRGRAWVLRGARVLALLGCWACSTTTADHPVNHPQRDAGIIVGATGLVVAGVAGVVAADDVSATPGRRRVEAALVGAGVLAGGVGLVMTWDACSPTDDQIEFRAAPTSDRLNAEPPTRAGEGP